MRHDTVDRALIAQVCEQPLRRELALSERTVSWLVERHDELLARFNSSLEFRGVTLMPLELRVELQSIEDELIDRNENKELEWMKSNPIDKTLYDRAQAIIQRGSNR